jgi:PelA/Pel-15E family pectate lyase
VVRTNTTSSYGSRRGSQLARAIGLLLCLLSANTLFGAVIGTNVSAQPLTLERVAAEAKALRPEWEEYLKRSIAQEKADKAALAAELQAAHLATPLVPPAGKGASSLPLTRSAAWYGGSEGQRIADNILSYQTPAGGWSKNLDMTKHSRQPGEAFAEGNASSLPSKQDFDQPRDLHWSYVGTIDNEATVTQLRFLARAASAARGERAEPYAKGFQRGLAYLFAAQFPNGGWPQVWPLQGGYHDAITFNDNAMINVLTLLREVASGQGQFAFVPADQRSQAEKALAKGIDCILRTQVAVDGRLTVWCQQHDALTLRPCSARNYEMPSLASAESSSVVSFLMDIPKPDPQVAAAVRAAVAWFERTGIRDRALTSTGAGGRILVTRPGAARLWARCYEIGTDRPIFGDRDKSIHDDMSEISRERRKGYGWYRTSPEKVIRRFRQWSQAHP